MPPDTPPPDDARRPSSSSSTEGGNVVDPAVLAERRAQRAEQGEQSAERRAADAQVLAAQLARERARLEAERDAARAEAAAAREGADAAIAEARHMQTERDALRAALEQARAERDAPDRGRANGHGVVPVRWADGLRRELAVARTVAAVAPRTDAVPPTAAPAPALARERRLIAQRAAAGPVAGAKASPASEAEQRRGDRAAPITALALERERSSRLQAQLDSSLAVQRELRTHIAALQRAVHQRVEAERRIEAALRRVREELTAANALAAARGTPLGEPAGASALTQPAGAFAATSETTPAPPRDPPSEAAGSAPPAVASAPPDALSSPGAPPAETGSAPPSAAPIPPDSVQPSGTPQPGEAVPAPTPVGLDPLRLSAARERLRATTPVEQPSVPPPSGPPAPWITAALKRLLADDPEAAGRLAVGLLPALGLAAERPMRYDLTLAGRGCFAADAQPGAATTLAPRTAPRPCSERDLAIVGDDVGLARLLHGRRTRLRRPARVRGGRRALRELRRLAQARVGLRDLGSAGVALEPALALRLVALAIDPEATSGERFAVAHEPLGGGPVDAWLRIAEGAPPAVVTKPPAEPTRITLRCTRGALLALLAGADPPPGESGALDGDDAALALLRGWIAAREHPGA